MRTVSIGLAVTFCLVAASHAQESPADWIRKLGSGNYVERERAAKQLEFKGKSVLPLLRNAIGNADLETRRRVMLLMERIEDRALRDDLVAPTLTRLRFQDVDLNDALGNIEAQTGLRLGRVNTKYRIKSIDTGERPFWQAWSKFCTDANLEEGDYANSAAKLMPMRESNEELLKYLLTRDEFDLNTKFHSPGINFSNSKGGQRYASDDRGSIRVRARWLMMNHQIDKATPHAVLAFELRGEPRLAITGAPRIELTKIVDDAGVEKSVQTARLLSASLSPRDANVLSAFAGEVQYGGLLHLKAIPWTTASGKLQSLHGSVRLDVIVRPNLLEVAQVLKSVGKSTRGYDGVTLKVLESDTTEEGDLALRLHLENLDSLTPQTQEQKFFRVRPGLITERGAIDVALERIELLDARGQPYRKVKSRYQQAKVGAGYEVELRFASKVGKDDPTLVLTKGPRTIALNVPFEVHDVTWEASRRP